ncbi:MAG: putative multidrug export ATP-binding/permease protein [Verrucomicrobia bacterium ADurb.Bin006]|jgi:subfamily B ATP-binding cassette protein MsbA|nr:MAG: putative multidrug export ATP-binding/permease protein [Verrucomicrobia bacterium ADurb.Bin006]
MAKGRSTGEHGLGMNNILTVLRFGCGYLPRYWVRLALSVVFGGVFALTNGSFMWATRTLTERFAPAAAAPAQPGPSDARDRFSVAIERLGQSVQRAIDPWLPRAGQPLEWRQAVGLLLLLPILVFLRSGADYGNNYCLGWVSERVVRDMRLDVMEKLSQLSLEFFTRSRTGDLLTRINVDTYNLLRALRQGVADLIKESFTIMVVFCGLLWLDWRLTCAAMVLLPACLLPLMVLGRKAHRAMAVSRKANVLQSSQLVELLGSIRVVKAYNLEAVEMARFRRTSGQLVRAGMKGVKAKELVNPLIEIISVLGLGALLLYVFQAGRSGPELVAFITGILLFFLPLKKLAGVHIVFEQASVGVHRLSELLAEQPKVVEAPNPKPVSGFESELRFERVSFAYDDRVVLKDVNLVIPRGARLGVAGDSGSGKTTLLNLLFRFYDPTSGMIRIDGTDLREVSIRDLRGQLALVSQDVTIFDQTVAENIACGRSGASIEEVEAAARAASAHEFILALPEGYDTRVGERGVTLSGGQRQRVAIARAFVRNAPILVLDEATAALDSKAEAEVQAAIDRLAEHRTVICVAHRLSTLAGMDQIIVLSRGCIVETGGFKALLNRGGVFAAMAARQGLYPSSG